MKRYLPIIVATIVPAVIVVAIYVTAPATEGPRVQVERGVDQELSKARRILDGYDPGAQFLSISQRQLTGEGGSFEATDARVETMRGAWDKAASQIDESTTTRPISADVETRLTEARGTFARMAGGEQPEASARRADDPAAAYQAIEQWLDKNNNRLKEAINVVDAALRLTSEGDDGASGRNDVEANRLRAILAFHYAESLRRSALMERSRIERASERLAHLYGRWIDVTGDIAIAERALTGRTSPTTAVGTRPAASRPSRLMGRLFGAISRRKAKGSEAPATAPAAEEAAPVTVEPSEPIRPIPEWIAEMRQQRRQIEARVAEMEKQLADLQGAHAKLSEQIKARRAEAAAAGRKMVELENQGFDPSNPEVLKSRTAEYEAASRAGREAARQADLLEFGGYANAVLVSDREEWHTARIAPARAGETLVPQKSLRQFQQEIDSTTATLEGERTALAVLDNRIEKLQKLQVDYQARLDGDPSGAATQPAAPGLRRQRDRIAAEAGELVKRIAEASQKANADEDAAVEEIERGIKAAEQAKSALSLRKNEARELSAGEGEPNPRLQKIEQENWRAGDADALIGDLHLLEAWLRYQRKLARERLAATLAQARNMGADVDPKAEANAAAAEAQPARAAADAAAKSYTDAESDLKSDWTLHMNLAATYYLLSNLTQGAEAQTHRNNAIKEYQSGVAGQETNPERRPYAERLEAIEKAAR